jgi:hypothetical protein
LRQAVLQHVVAGAALERFDRPLLAERAGDEDERRVRRPLAREVERLEAVEARQVVVRENEVRLVALEALQEILAAVDALEQVRQAGLAEGVLDEFGVRDVVPSSRMCKLDFMRTRGQEDGSGTSGRRLWLQSLQNVVIAAITRWKSS